MCLGGVVPATNPTCSPVTVLEDRGRRLDLVWEPDLGGPAYRPQFELTLSPERTEMAGRFWSATEAPAPGATPRVLDALFVRVPGSSVPAPTACSGGEPSGECFRGPLAADLIGQVLPPVSIGDDVLVAWGSRRAVEWQLAFARYDATKATWTTPRLLETSTETTVPQRMAASAGSALIVYGREARELFARPYDPVANTWGELQTAATVEDGEVAIAHGLTMDEAGNAALLFGPVGFRMPLFASRHDAGTLVWSEPTLLDETADAVSVAADDEGELLAIWRRDPPETLDAPWELRFTRGNPSGVWRESAPFYTSDALIFRLSVAFGPDGAAVAVWEELETRIVASVYSRETETWSEAQPIVTDPLFVYPRLSFADDGAPRVSFRRSDTSETLTSVLDRGSGEWGMPQPLLEGENATCSPYATASSRSEIAVGHLGTCPNEVPIPSIVLGACQGY
jgi:hypothetical protein